MEALFKFVLERPAVEISNEDAIIDLSQNSDYQAALAKSIDKADPRKVLKEASRQFVKSNGYLDSIKKLSIYDKLKLFTTTLDTLEKKSPPTHNDLKKAVKDSFGETVEQTLNNKDYIDAVSNLKDSIIAIKQLNEEQHNSIKHLVDALRDLLIIKKLSTDNSFPDNEDELIKYRKRSLKLPSQADLKSILTTRESAKKVEEERRQNEKEKAESINSKMDLYRKLKRTVKEIMKLDNDHLNSTKQTTHSGFMPPTNIQPLNVFVADMERMNALGKLQILNVKTQVEKGQNVGRITEEKDLSKIVNDIGTTKKAKTYFSGTGEFRPLTSLITSFRFTPGTEKLLSKESLEILKQRNLDITKMAVDKIIQILKNEMNEISNELEIDTSTQMIKSFQRIGNTLIVKSTPKVSSWINLATFENPLYPILPAEESVPSSKGSISPAGIADLLIVKQHLKRYEGTDIAHIENVLKGEKKVRDHRRLRQTEEITLTETETTTEEERDLESTDRFELSREASKTIKEDASLKAGLSVSGSYGPTVKFSASAEGSLSRSKEEATKTASKFSKDVTQKSSKKLTERILQRIQMKVTNEVEEKNNHTLDNVQGAGHISGIYQWVEKIYEAQMYNYGLRMLFDFMIPEPGSFIIDAMQKAYASVMEIEKPIPFTLKPNQINEVNYNYWIHRYGAGGIEPPPEEYLTKSLDYSAGEGDEKTDYYHSGIIEIDEGYKAIHATVGSTSNQWSSNKVVDVVLGTRAHRFVDDGQWVWTTSLSNETDSIPFGLKTNEVSDIVAIVEVKCQRTDRAWKKWQLQTHSKIMEAYQAKLADYEEKLAAIQMQAGVEIEGKNPALNLEIMNEEIKKNCISIITDQHYDLFNSIESGTNNLPQINLSENEAEGPYVRFFEQAFEWENMTWLTYPYFWGRKNQWEEKISFDDPDPLFNQFIKSGYCRTVVPVRPGFEGAVDHFLTFGEIWNGGPLPTISNPLYIAIADEIAERLDQPGDEIPQGDPWDVHVPTTLVHLRDDDELPKWKKDNDGNWIPDE